MQLEPGMRVRCVFNKGVEWGLVSGAEYTVLEHLGVPLVRLQGLLPFSFAESRFKPIVRVKCGSEYVTS